jgi:hypothetical protein
MKFESEHSTFLSKDKSIDRDIILWAACHSCLVDKSVAADALLRLGLGLVHPMLTKGGRALVDYVLRIKLPMVTRHG